MTISDEVRKALVAVYGVVPPLPVPRADVQKVRLALAKELFGRTLADKEDREEFLDDRARYAKHNHLNRYLVEATGVGSIVVYRDGPFPSGYRTECRDYPSGFRQSPFCRGRGQHRSDR